MLAVNHVVISVLPVTRPEPQTTGDRLDLSKPDAADQSGESGVGADGIEIGMGFEELQDIGLLTESLFERDEGLIVIAQS